jgi:hypothetical protein
LRSKISRTVRGGEEVARNIRKGCRTGVRNLRH